MNKLVITLDYIDDECLSYEQAKKAIKENQVDVCTCCLNFFTTGNTKTHHVIAIKKSGIKIDLNEELVDSAKYIDREVRMAHNAEKMLKTGCFTFR